jgi:hypothetical protein
LDFARRGKELASGSGIDPQITVIERKIPASHRKEARTFPRNAWPGTDCGKPSIPLIHRQTEAAEKDSLFGIR